MGVLAGFPSHPLKRAAFIAFLLGLLAAVEVFATDPVSPSVAFYSPQVQVGVSYKLKVGDDGGITIEVGGQAYQVRSRFSSTTDHRWNSLGVSDTGWKVRVSKGVLRKYVIRAEDKRYKLERIVDVHPAFIAISDKFTNLSDSTDTGIIFENAVASPGQGGEFHVAGIPFAAFTKSFYCVKESDGRLTVNQPERPFVQIASGGRSSLGMVAVDDIFRIQSECYYQPGVVGIMDRHFGLAPGASYVVRWQLYPLECADHYSFVNAVRRAWGTNFRIDGPFGFIMGTAPDDLLKWPDEKIRQWLKETGLRTICCVVNKDDGMVDHKTIEAFGGAYLYEANEQRVAWRKVADRLHRIDPTLKVVAYYHFYCSNEKDCQQKYASDRLIQEDGTQFAFTNWCGKAAHYFCPTRTNDFGLLERKVFDQLNADFPDGIYWDEKGKGWMSTYTYGPAEWDQHSVNINPDTHEVARRISNVTLISQPLEAELVRKLLRSGKVPYCNWLPPTQTATDWHLPQFIEFVTVEDAARAHLTSPLSLGVGDSSKPTIQMVHDFLDMGILYVCHWSNGLKQPSDIIAQIYPITPVEVHVGYVIGKEKIVANRSGAFGWGDKRITGRAFVYGADGKLTDQTGTRVMRDGKMFVEIELKPGEVAVITRRKQS